MLTAAEQAFEGTGDTSEGDRSGTDGGGVGELRPLPPLSFFPALTASTLSGWPHLPFTFLFAFACCVSDK